MLNYSKYNHWPDEDLLAAYSSSANADYLAIILHRYTLLLLGVAMKYLKDKEQSADAVQQVFLKILSMNKLPPIQNCKAWLFIVMRNHCLQLLRHKNHTLSADALAVEVDRIEDEEEEDWWKSEATLQHLQGALQQLPTDQMRCISLFYLQQISYQQIMDQHGYTFTQVKSFIQNGKRNLKNILSQKINETGGNK